MNDDRQSLDEELTADEQFRAVKLMEEAAEVIQACSKLLRFGAFNFHPTLPAEYRASHVGTLRVNNTDTLEREILHFINAARAIFPHIGQ